MPSRTAYSWPQLAQTSLPSTSCVSRSRLCRSFNVLPSARRSSCVGGVAGRAGKPSCVCLLGFLLYFFGMEGWEERDGVDAVVVRWALGVESDGVFNVCK